MATAPQTRPQSWVRRPDATLEVQLRAELDEPPLKDLRGRPPVRADRVVLRKDGAAVHQVVDVHRRAHAAVAEAEVLPEADVELRKAIAIQRAWRDQPRCR